MTVFITQTALPCVACVPMISIVTNALEPVSTVASKTLNFRFVKVIFYEYCSVSLSEVDGHALFLNIIVISLNYILTFQINIKIKLLAIKPHP